MHPPQVEIRPSDAIETALLVERHLRLGLQRGYQDAWSGMQAQHTDGLQSYFLRWTSNVDDAADLVQDTFLDAWRNRLHLVDQPVAPWLFAIGHLNAHRWWRRNRSPNRPVVMGSFAHRSAEQMVSLTSDLDTERQAMSHLAMDGALACLSSPLRESFLLHVVDNQCSREIAIRLGITVSAAEQRIQRSQLAVRQHLSRAL